MRHPYLIALLAEALILWFMFHKTTKDENMNDGWIVGLVLTAIVFGFIDVVVIAYNLIIQ